MADGTENAPLLTAAAMQMARDELWRNPSPLAADCDHDLLCLLVIEARQTVLCRKCGGLDADTSRRMLTEPGKLVSDEIGAPARLLKSGLRVKFQVARDEFGTVP
jgi:hypothetical protein